MYSTLTIPTVRSACYIHFVHLNPFQLNPQQEAKEIWSGSREEISEGGDGAEIKVEEEHEDGMGWHRGLRTWILFLSAAPALTVVSTAPLTVICLHPADMNGLLTPLYLKLQTGWPFLFHHSTFGNLKLNVQTFFVPFTDSNLHLNLWHKVPTTVYKVNAKVWVDANRCEFALGSVNWGKGELKMSHLSFLYMQEKNQSRHTVTQRAEVSSLRSVVPRDKNTSFTQVETRWTHLVAPHRASLCVIVSLHGPGMPSRYYLLHICLPEAKTHVYIGHLNCNSTVSDLTSLQ